MLKMFTPYRDLPKDVYTLFLANVINRLGDFVSPLLALYLTQKLHMSVEISGSIVMIALLSRIPGSFSGGKSADKFGRRNSYLVTQTLAAISLLPCAFINNHYAIIALLILSTFFNGAARPALDALAIDLIPEDRRNSGLSLMYIGINVGVAVGPAIAGLLFKVNLPLFFICDVTTSLIAVVLVGLRIKEKFTFNDNKKASNTGLFSGKLINFIKSHLELALFLLIVAAFSIVYSQATFSLPIMFSNEFKEKGSSLLGTIFSINAITVLVATSYVSAHTKKNPPHLNVIFGGLLYALGFGLYGVGQGFIFYAFTTIIWTFGEILIVINIKAYMAENTPIEFRGRVSAFYQIFSSIFKAMGVLLSGWFISTIGYKEIWLFVSIAAALLSSSVFIVNYSFSKPRKPLAA